MFDHFPDIFEDQTVTSLYYAISLLRHRTRSGVLEIETSGIVDDISDETAHDWDLALKIVNEIEKIEGMEVHLFSDSKADMYIAMLSDAVQEIARKEHDYNMDRQDPVGLYALRVMKTDLYNELGIDWSAERQTRLRNEEFSSLEKTRQELERIRQDIYRMQEIQSALLPREELLVTPVDGPSLVASGTFFPAEQIGGDYYGYFRLPGDKVGLAIGDVSGHGIHSGLLLPVIEICLRTQIKSDYSIPAVMSTLNDVIFKPMVNHLWLSFCYIIVDLRKHTFSFSNAGHVFPYHYRADKGQMEMLETNNIMLGIFVSLDSTEYEITTSDWSENDVFVLYTDGIIEQQSADGYAFGEERLRQLIIENAYRSPAELKEIILSQVRMFHAGIRQTDDIALLVAKVGHESV